MIFSTQNVFEKKSTENLILAASKLTRQMSKSRMKVVIDDDTHSPDRKVSIHFHFLKFALFTFTFSNFHFFSNLQRLWITGIF